MQPLIAPSLAASLIIYADWGRSKERRNGSPPVYFPRSAAAACLRRFSNPSHAIRKSILMVFSLRHVGGNALSILTSDVMNRAASFVIYAMVARRLGAQEFGQLALAFSVFYMFQIFSIAGLKVLIIRQVARDRSQTRLYFLNSCAILTLSTLLSIIVLLVFLRLMHYAPSTSLIVLLLSL